MKKKRLFIHIGSHKTATTYLQSLFHNNRDLLLKNNLLYPATGIAHEAHHELAWSLRDKQQDSTDLLLMPRWQALVEEIEGAAADTALISSEDFEWNAFKPDWLRPLHQHFDLHVIFFLRQPDLYVESYYNQLVKDFDTRESRTLERYLAEEPLFFLQSERILNRWAELVGDDKMHVRLFEEASREGSIETSLLAITGLEKKLQLATQNPSIAHKASLPPDALELIRQCNPSLRTRKGHFQWVLQLAATAGLQSGALQQTRCGLLSLRMKENVLRRVADSNRRVSKRFLGVDKNPYPASIARAHPGYEKRQAQADSSTLATIVSHLLLSHEGTE